LLNAEKIDRTVKKGKLVRDFLATLWLKDLDAEVNRFQNMKQKLLENGKITAYEAKRVDKLIQEWIEENKKIHEKYPNRR
jgi:polyhydroxyalkanoate synthesis regulator phasin